jgi:hypothetical protein
MAVMTPTYNLCSKLGEISFTTPFYLSGRVSFDTHPLISRAVIDTGFAYIIAT